MYAENGRDVSVTDGEWVIHFGVGGWVRYIGFFGLLCWPLIGLFISKRHRIDPVCAMLALILSAKLVDLIPNAGLVPYIWLIAGSLLGRLELSLSDRKPMATDVIPAVISAPQYRRSFVQNDAHEPSEELASETRSYSRTDINKKRRF